MYRYPTTYQVKINLVLPDGTKQSVLFENPLDVAQSEFRKELDNALADNPSRLHQLLNTSNPIACQLNSTVNYWTASRFVGGKLIVTRVSDYKICTSPSTCVSMDGTCAGCMNRKVARANHLFSQFGSQR